MPKSVHITVKRIRVCRGNREKAINFCPPWYQLLPTVVSTFVCRSTNFVGIL